MFELTELKVFVTVANACSFNLRLQVPVYECPENAMEIMEIEHLQYCFELLSMKKYAQEKVFKKLVENLRQK